MSTGGNDVTDAFSDWLETIIGARTIGSYVDGRWVEGTPSALSFSGVVQNAEPEDLKVLSEGNRTEEAIKIHTTFDLIAQVSNATGDKITYEGDIWLVYNIAKKRIGNYNKVLAIKQ